MIKENILPVIQVMIYEEKIYTLKEIKQAFWAKFHESGELWFGYQRTEEENAEDTQSEWDDFIDELKKITRERDGTKARKPKT